MRHYFPWISLICLIALSGCGNGNDGRKLGSKGRSSAEVSAIGFDSNNSSIATKLSYCKTLTVLSGSNPAFASTFAGSEICKVDNPAPIVRLKVSAQFPVNSRFCLVPMNEFALRESCFTVNGQTDIFLDPTVTSYTSIVLLAETDLNAYKAFLNYQTNTAPPRAVALMQL